MSLMRYSVLSNRLTFRRQMNDEEAKANKSLRKGDRRTSAKRDLKIPWSEKAIFIINFTSYVKKNYSEH